MEIYLLITEANTEEKVRQYLTDKREEGKEAWFLHYSEFDPETFCVRVDGDPDPVYIFRAGKYGEGEENETDTWRMGKGYYPYTGVKICDANHEPIEILVSKYMNGTNEQIEANCKNFIETIINTIALHLGSDNYIDLDDIIM